MHGFSYDCWEGHPALPRLNLGEPAVREHIFDVARFWLKEVGIDGRGFHSSTSQLNLSRSCD